MAEIDLSSQLNDVLQLYKDDVLSEVKSICKEESDDLVNTLKNTSPKRTGKYAKSWTAQDQSDSSLSASFIVYNKRYQLTHLLENGHLNRDGSRTEAIPHIAPAVAEVETSVLERIQEAVSRT